MTENPLAVRSTSATDLFKWSSFILFLAALYNIAWGTAVVVAPRWTLELAGMPATANSELWQCIGMLVGVYGIAYWIASLDPLRYWPIILVGFIGKVLGPIGGVSAVYRGTLPSEILWVNATNDILWLVPFAYILWNFSRGPAEIQPTEQVNDRVPLYRRVLGSEFDKLAPQIRDFHDAVNPIEVAGTFSATRGTNWLTNWLADRTGFPRSHDGLAVRLRVEQHRGTEHWHREFGDSEVDSQQWQARGLLAERYGPIVLYLKARVTAGALEVVDVRSTFLGVPLPPFLTPRVYAHGVDGSEGMEIRVQVSLSPFGLLVEYAGIVAISRRDASAALTV